MEFRLNKIDTDILRKIQEETEDGKIHSNNFVTIKKDMKEDDNKNEGTKKENNKHLKKRFCTIDGIKYTNSEILDVDVEKVQDLDEENSKGRILDIKK